MPDGNVHKEPEITDLKKAQEYLDLNGFGMVSNVVDALKNLKPDEFINGINWLLNNDRFLKKPPQFQQRTLHCMFKSILEDEEYKEFLKTVIGSNFYKDCDEESRASFLYGAVRNLVNNRPGIKNTFALMSQDSVIVFSPKGKMNPDWENAFEFNSSRGVGMVGGLCTTKFTDRAYGANGLLERYSDGRPDRLDQPAKIAVMSHTLALNSNMLGISADVTHKLFEDARTLGLEDIPVEERMRFQEEIEIEFNGIDL